MNILWAKQLLVLEFSNYDFKNDHKKVKILKYLFSLTGENFIE